MMPTKAEIDGALMYIASASPDSTLGIVYTAYQAKCAEVEELRKALKVADEAMSERRSYAEESWGWKYGETWDEEDAIVSKALEGKE